MAIRVTRAGVGLIIGIIVLAGLTAGALYFVKQRGEAARRDETLKIAEQQLKDDSNKIVALNQGDNSSDKKQDEDAKSESPSDSGSTTLPGSAEQGSGAGSGDQSSFPTTGPSTVVTELPQTGLGDWQSIVAVAMLSISIAAYISSRRGL